MLQAVQQKKQKLGRWGGDVIEAQGDVAKPRVATSVPRTRPFFTNRLNRSQGGAQAEERCPAHHLQLQVTFAWLELVAPKYMEP